MKTETLKHKVIARIAKYNPNEAEDIVNRFYEEAFSNGYKTVKQLSEAILTYEAM